MAVSLSGLASGLDTNSIIEQTMEIDRQPIYSKMDQKQKYEDEKKIWKEIDGQMSSLRSASNDLKYSSTFGAMTVDSSEETLAVATAANNSAQTTYILEDIVMAKAGQKTSSTSVNLSDGQSANVESLSTLTDKNQRFNDGTSVVAGSFKINGKLIEVEEGDTLSLVINKINASGGNVEASFDKDTFNFKLETKDSLSTSKIELDGTDTSGFLAAVGLGDKVGEKIDNGVSPDYKRTIAEVKADENTDPNSQMLNMESGFFTINGFTFEVNEEEDTLSNIVKKINNSEAGVVAFYDNDTKKITLTAEKAGEDIVLENDTSGFLTSMNLLETTETLGTGDGTEVSYTLGSIPSNSNGIEITIGDTTYSGASIITSGEPLAGEVLIDLSSGNIKFGTAPELDKEIKVSYDSEKMTYEGTGASVKINGVLFEKDSNEFEVNGVSIELKSNTGEGEKVTLKVQNNTQAAYEKIEAFVNKYNELIDNIESKTQKDGELQGNSTANNLKYSLRRNLTNTVSGVESAYNQLALIGVTAEDNRSGRLTLDASKLKEILAVNPDAVQKLFTQAAGVSTMEDESVDTGDGEEKVFGLDKVPDNLDEMSITVGGVTYTKDGTYKLISSGTPSASQILVNLSTGQLTFGAAPDDGSEIKASYEYEDVASGGGIAERVTDFITPYTQYSGTFDSKIESLGDRVTTMDKWIENQTRLLEMRQESLRKQYAAMEQAIQTSNSQGQWLSQQISGL